MKWSIILFSIAVLILLPFSVREAYSDDSSGDDFNAAKYAAMKETREWFKKSDISFGSGWRKVMYCTPVYKGNKLKIKQQLYSLYPEVYFHTIGGASFEAFDDSSLDKYFKALPGDSVLIIWKQGTTRAVIKQIGKYDNGCNQDLMCCLELAYPDEECPNGKFIVLTSHELINYTGPFIPYDSYEIDEPAIPVLEDSLRNVLIEAFIDHKINTSMNSFDLTWNKSKQDRKRKEILERIDKHNIRENYMHLRYFGRKQSQVPDTLLLCATTFLGGMEQAWVADYKLIRSDNGWHLETLREPDYGYGVKKLMAAVDLNGDGELEYLWDSGVSVGLSTIIGKSMIKLISSGNWGC